MVAQLCVKEGDGFFSYRVKAVCFHSGEALQAFEPAGAEGLMVQRSVRGWAPRSTRLELSVVLCAALGTVSLLL